MAKHIILVWIFSLIATYPTRAFQSKLEPDPENLKPGHYIVVAAYKADQEVYARKYARLLNQNQNISQVGFDATRNLYYVYLSSFNDFSESVQEMLKVRASTKFSDAWVRVLKEGVTSANTITTKESSSTTITRASETLASVPVASVEEKESIKEESIGKEATVATINTKMMTNLETEVIDNPIPAPIFRPQTLKSTPVFLSIYNPRNGSLIDSDIEIIDTDMNRLITKVKGNSYVNLPDPKNKSGKLTLIASPFGYRKVQNVINFRETEADTLQPYVDLVGNFYMVKFDMIRYHPGDIVTLYNVYFFNDAAIMLPESKYELNSLLAMMKENPNYRIKLHGHTNGKSRGKIVSMGPSREFFKVTSDAIESTGSAKELSQARAGVIKDWLVANGVTEDRIEIKAWGGDRMLHDRNSPHARRNVRVEVEVLQE